MRLYRAWRAILSVALFVAITVCLVSCQKGAGNGAIAPDELVIQAAKQLYKQSSLVIIGECVGSAVSAPEYVSYSIQISEIIAGYAVAAKPIECAGKALEVGSNYLLFIKYDASSGKNMILGDEAHKVSDNTVHWNKEFVSLTALLDELYAYSAVITVPAATYFYSKFARLIETCDIIVIGEITELPNAEAMTVKSNNGTTLMEYQTTGKILRVRTLGYLKGYLKYNTVIRVVDIPGTVSGMIDDASLGAVSYTESSVIYLELHKVYMFFLKTGYDNKRDYYFPINPIQGWVAIDRDNVTVSLHNTPIYGYRTLPPMVTDIAKHVAQAGN